MEKIPPKILLQPYPQGILVTIPSVNFSYMKEMSTKQMVDLAIELLSRANVQHNEPSA